MNDIPFPVSLNTGAPATAPTRHCLALDCSGSMEDDDYPPTRRGAGVDAVAAFVERLRTVDPMACVGVLGYDDRAFVLSELAPAIGYPPEGLNCTEWHRLAAEQGGGCTAIGRALALAADWLQFGAGDAQVVLLTDGHNNAGPDPVDVARRLRGFATLAAVGIGGSPSDVDEDLLRQIVSRDPSGHPRYRWIGERDALVAHYEELAGYLTRD